MIEKRGWNDRRPRPDVEERRQGNAVDEVTRVGRWGAADVEVRQPADHRGDARQRFDGLERFAKGPRDVARFASPHLVRSDVARSGLRAVHRDLGRRRRVARRGRARRGHGHRRGIERLRQKQAPGEERDRRERSQHPVAILEQSAW